MSNTTYDVIFDESRTRACLKTKEGEFVCSTMTIKGNPNDPDAITLTPVGKTRNGMRARMWIAIGVPPQDE